MWSSSLKGSNWKRSLDSMLLKWSYLSKAGMLSILITRVNARRNKCIGDTFAKKLINERPRMDLSKARRKSTRFLDSEKLPFFVNVHSLIWRMNPWSKYSLRIINILLLSHFVFSFEVTFRDFVPNAGNEVLILCTIQRLDELGLQWMSLLPQTSWFWKRSEGKRLPYCGR